MSSSENARAPCAVIEFCDARRAVAGASEPAARADVLAYVEEMCVTLSYLTALHNCRQLSGILTSAATVASAARGGVEDTAL